MKTTRKITVQAPAELIEKARRTTGIGVTATVGEGLQLAAVGDAYQRLRELRGKVSIPIDLARLREDRE